MHFGVLLFNRGFETQAPPFYFLGYAQDFLKNYWPWLPLALAGLWKFFLREYQRERILDFLDPSRDPLASGYQALQSKIAVGSGGLFGMGWTEGTQTKLRFLPTRHSDFAFSMAVSVAWETVCCTASSTSCAHSDRAAFNRSSISFSVRCSTSATF